MASNILSELNKELYEKVIKLKKKYAYENIPYTVAHTLDTLTGPPRDPYSIISKQSKNKWPINNEVDKCFYDINGQYFCKINPPKVVVTKDIKK